MFKLAGGPPSRVHEVGLAFDVNGDLILRVDEFAVMKFKQSDGKAHLVHNGPRCAGLEVVGAFDDE